MIKLAVKKIDGKKYLYASDYIYLNKGIGILKNKSLGRAESITDTPQKLSEFKKNIEIIEVQERTKYWEPRVMNKKAFGYTKVGKLEDLRTKLYRGKQSLGYIGDRAMETAFIIDFIYNSNKIEGSRLPQKRVSELVQKGIHGKNNEAKQCRFSW